MQGALIHVVQPALITVEKGEFVRGRELPEVVFAVALACWGARKMFPSALYGPDGYWVGNPGNTWMKETNRLPGI